MSNATGQQNNISKTIINRYQVPLPPLPVQEEIVRILDEFTELEVELEAELEARTKQYEYYRNTLLDFSTGKVGFPKIDQLLKKYCPEGVRQVPFSTIIKENSGGATPSKSNSNYWSGEIPWVSVKDIVKSKKFLSTATDFVTDLALKETNLNLLNTGHLIVCTRISPGLCTINNYPVTINQDLRAIKLTDNALIDYVYYVLKGINFLGKGTTVKGIGVKELESTLISLPPLPVQQEIVRILDEFSEYTTSLNKGLPAEIELRKKQYEYYRNQLLTF
jgi:type I restriction enzyme S subunit